MSVETYWSLDNNMHIIAQVIDIERVNCTLMTEVSAQLKYCDMVMGTIICKVLVVPRPSPVWHAHSISKDYDASRRGK